MIKWLMPLGLLGLLGILVLILIYIIRPKYQQRFITSTVLWRQLLKRKRKKLPIEPIRNILVFVCQALAFTSLALLMAQPKLFSEGFVNDETEKIIIIDSSASMLAHTAGDPASLSRFDRAVREVKAHIDEWLMDDDGTISIITAGKEAEYVLTDATKEEYTDVVHALDGLKCSYGTADIQGALNLAEERLFINPAAKIFVYSGTDLGNLGSAVTVRNLANIQNEWNIAVLGCTVAIEESEYVFHVEVGAFGRVSLEKNLYIEIKGAENGEDKTFDFPKLYKKVAFDVNSDNLDYSDIQTITLRMTDPEIGGQEDWYFSSYAEASIGFVDLNDSIDEDNEFKVYGGVKDKVKIQYYSSKPNIFYYLSFQYLRDPMSKTREIGFNRAYTLSEVQNEGHDFYIFEHTLPKDIQSGNAPKDGVILFSDPNDLSAYGVELGENVTFNGLKYFEAGDAHPLLQYIDPHTMGVTAYRRITSYDESFVPILFCGGDPVMLVKKTETERIVVMPFSLNLSNLSAGTNLTKFCYNLIQYFMPLTLDNYEFEADEEVNVNCKGTTVTMTDPNGKADTLTEFPATVTLEELGTYTFTTEFPYEKEAEVRKAFVHIPTSESGLFDVEAMNMKLDNTEVWEELGEDLFLYFAIAMLVLFTVEWCLQFKGI